MAINTPGNIPFSNFSSNTITSNTTGDSAGSPPTGNAGGDLSGSYPNPTLPTVNSSPGTYGDGTHVASLTVNGKGLVTSASSVSITGASPTGSASGDLSASYPSPTVAKINGNTLGSTTPTSGNLLIGSSSSWETQSISGNVTVNSSGVTTIGATQVTNSMLAGSIDLTTKVTNVLPEANGGTHQSAYATGDILYSSASNALSKLAGNTTTTKKFLTQTGNGSISAAPGWNTISTSDVPNAALTKTDDTNVTLTLGGSPSTALLNAASLTLGWTGQLALAKGGLNANLTASNGGIFYSTSSAGAVLAGTATAHQMLLSGASGAPIWSTATMPLTAGASNTILKSDGTNFVSSTSTYSDSYTTSNLLYASGSNAVSGLATANNGTLVTNGSGVPSISATLPTAVQQNITKLGTLTSIVQNSAQPIFYAYVSSDIPNVTGDGTVYNIIFNTTLFDQNSNFNTSTGTFTAPVTGLYQFNYTIKIGNIGVAHNVFYSSVTVSGTSSGIYQLFDINPSLVRDTANKCALSGPVTIKMTANDTIVVKVAVNSGTKTITVVGSSPSGTGEQCSFSGFLIG